MSVRRNAEMELTQELWGAKMATMILLTDVIHGATMKTVLHA